MGVGDNCVPAEHRQEAKAEGLGARAGGMLGQSWAMFQLGIKQIDH